MKNLLDIYDQTSSKNHLQYPSIQFIKLNHPSQIFGLCRAIIILHFLLIKKNISTNMPVSEADKLFLCCRKFLVAIRAKEFLYQIMITSIIGHVSLCTKFLKYLNDIFLEQKFLISCRSRFVMLNHSSTPWHGHLFWKDSIPKMH